MDLDRIPNSSDDNESFTNRDFADAELDNSKLNIDILNESKNKRFILNTRLRLYLAIWASLLVSSWMYKVGEIVVHNNTDYCLSDNVIIALLTTTTIEVLGIIAIAMKDIFNNKSEEKIN